jgi:hypothetical protein
MRNVPTDLTLDQSTELIESVQDLRAQLADSLERLGTTIQRTEELSIDVKNLRVTLSQSLAVKR